MEAAQSLVFPPFRLDLANRQLWRGTKLLPLRPKTWAVLHYLIEHPDRLITRAELLQAVWPKTYVSPGLVKVCVRELRAVLGDEAETPRFIETLGRQGYRFIAPLSTAPPPVPSSKPVLSAVEGFKVPSWELLCVVCKPGT